MKSTHFAILFFIISGLFVNACGNGDAMDPKDGKSSATIVEDDRLSLSISVWKERFFLGEPVYLRAKLTNNSNSSIRLSNILDPIGEAMNVTISGPQEKRFRFSPLAQGDFDSSVLVDLEPGESIEDVFSIFFGSQGWTFTTSGKHDLRAAYQIVDDGQIRVVRSTPISIDIDATADQSGELLVSNDDASIEAGKFMTWQSGDHLEEGISLFSKVDQESPIRDFIDFALGKSFSQPFSNYQTGSVRPADCAKSKEYFENLDLDSLDPHIQILINFAIVQCEARIGSDNTMNLIDSLESSIEGDTAYRGILERLREMRGFIEKQGNDKE